MITTNISVVVKGLRSKIQAIGDNPDVMLRTVAFAVLPEFKRRIHVLGEDANEQQIGTYSPGYMKVRTGNYRDAAKNKDGSDKEKKTKAGDAGVFSKGKNKGQPRPRYNRTGDTKVIASLTRQMENDLSVKPSGTGYGIGYSNEDNFLKSGYVEATYHRKIFSLTGGEKQLAKDTAQKFFDDFIKQ